MKKALLLVGSVLCTLLLANSTRADIATVTLSALSQTYDGTAKTVTITTDPPDLTVDVTYNGDSSAPTNAGSYTVVANVDDPTYTGSATNTLVINKAQATITATNLFPNYQGVPLMPTLTTSPVGLALNVTYSGSPDAPTLPGRYLVRAIVQDVNYQGTSSFLMRIRNSPAQITLIGLNQTYDGTPKGVTATTSPSGLAYTVAYGDDFSPTPPSAVGSYHVVVTVTDPIYGGAAAGTLVIGCPPIEPATWPQTGEWDFDTSLGAAIVPGTNDLGLHTVFFSPTEIDLPFPVQVYDRVYSNAWVNENGLIAFGDGGYAQSDNSSLPSFSPVNVLYPFWEIMVTDRPGEGVFTSVSGTAPDRIFNVEWRAHQYGGTNTAHFEARLYEKSARVDFIYGRCDDQGRNATVGAERAYGEAYNQYEYNTGGITNGLQLTFYTAFTHGLGGTYYYNVTSGSMPPGISIEPWTGSLLGHRTGLGTSAFTVDATFAPVFDGPPNTNGCEASQDYSVSMDCQTITINPPGSGYAIGDFVSAFSATGGKPVYHYAITSGALPTGVSFSADGTFSGQVLAIGANLFTVQVTDAMGCTATTNCIIAGFPRTFETNRPVLVIQTPPNNSVQLNAGMTVTGTAKDVAGKGNTGTASVWYSLNGTASQAVSTTNRFTNWTAQLTLQPGSNTFVATAVDYSGNTSTATRTFLYAATNVVGVYNGLFYETNLSALPAVTERSAGFVSIKAQVTGKYSGKIYIAGTNYSVNGQFDLSGNSSTTVSRGIQPSLSIDLHLDWTGVTKQMTGTVACVGEGWLAPLLADLSVFGTKNPHTAARYTMVIEPALDAPLNSPGGFGYGLVTVNKGGNIGLQGNLADSSAIKQTVPISNNGRWPLYVDLYKHHGLLEGWIDFSSGAPVGQVTWIKPLNAGVPLTTYLAGFTNTVNVDGSVYAPVTPSIAVPNGTLDITDASGLNLPLSLHVGVGINNTIVHMAPTTNAVSGSIATQTGLASVKFRPTGVGPVSKSSIGVVLQSSNAVYGAFIGNNDGAGKTNTGAIYLHQ